MKCPFLPSVGKFTVQGFYFPLVLWMLLMHFLSRLPLLSTNSPAHPSFTSSVLPVRPHSLARPPDEPLLKPLRESLAIRLMAQGHGLLVKLRAAAGGFKGAMVTLLTTHKHTPFGTSLLRRLYTSWSGLGRTRGRRGRENARLFFSILFIRVPETKKLLRESWGTGRGCEKCTVALRDLGNSFEWLRERELHRKSEHTDLSGQTRWSILILEWMLSNQVRSCILNSDIFF